MLARRRPPRRRARREDAGYGACGLERGATGAPARRFNEFLVEYPPSRGRDSLGGAAGAGHRDALTLVKVRHEFPARTDGADAAEPRNLFPSRRCARDEAQIDLRIVAASLRLVASDKVVKPIPIEGISIR